ncbi:MAG: FKBP-type peptidyl-prolyl cis-trans isomerase [Gammaproteobacteria bacterium]|nr:FKBP-type peptidyl-prolyl cis-trans isomerase [Gammaproteobacteria bacterium]MDH3447701.1 FKBP-type peptidyl-prolyl cis-trans isomerase [Gammaproteobacteria bacterium]
MSLIERNSRVTLHYRLGSTDDRVLEDNFDEEPMTVDLGQGAMAEGLELALIGLRPGDEQTIDIGPDLAFGHVDETLFRALPRAEFDPGFELEPGLIIEFATETGDTLPGTIIDFDDQVVHIDLNHPLAGQTVRYSVRIIAVENADQTLH